MNNDTTNHQQFFTWMTIDQSTGFLYAVFYDRRNYAGDTTDVYLAVSKNGGQSFDNYLISDTPFVPTHQVFFGDYTNISARNGMVRPIWTRLDNYNLSVWTALINFDSTATIIKTPHQTAKTVAGIYPNPAHRQTAFSYKLKQTERLSLQVIDNNGKLISLIFKEKTQSPGMYIEKFPVSGLSAGIYYFVLTGDKGSRVVKKFIVQ